MKLEQEAKKWLKEKYKDMEMNEYQKKSVEFAIYPHSHSILYPALGLAGEAGEVANKVKKFIRDGYDQENFEQKKVERLDITLFLITPLQSYLLHFIPSLPYTAKCC